MKKNIPTILIIIMFAVAARAESASPFTMNGWQLHEWDVPKTVEAIHKAPQYGVNFFILSHDIFRSVEGYLASDPKRDTNAPLDYVATIKPGQWSAFRSLPRPEYWGKMKQITDAADSEKIPYYLWVHEFDDIPDRFLVDGKVLNFDDPALFPYIKARYERLLNAMPGAAGLVLTFHESHYKMFRDSQVKSQLPVSERLYRTAMLIYEVCKEHHKQLILRNFFYEPREMAWCKEAIDRLPDDIIIMSKDTCHEFQPFYPFDPMHGDVGAKRQIMEIDASVEKALGPEGAYAQVHYLQQDCRRAYDKRLTGCVARVRMNKAWARPFEDVHEVNWYAFSRFMQNPRLDPDTVLAEWVQKHYPRAAVSNIVSAFKRTEFINHNGRYVLHFWSAVLFGWANYRYAYGHILLRTTYKWTGNPADRVLQDQLYHPDLDTYNLIMDERAAVVAAADASYADIQKAKPYLEPAQVAQLEESFRFLVDAARVQRACAALFWSQMMYVNGPTAENRERAEKAITTVQQVDNDPDFRYGLDPKTGSRYGMVRLIQEMRSRMDNLEAARAEDQKIITRESINPDTNDD